jgi:uncharacterized membrane protein YfcA
MGEMESKLILLMPLAFVCEFVDSTLGMGYGTSLTPILLLMGFQPLEVVPAVLLSEFVTGATAAFFHHSVHNVNFNRHSADTRVASVLTAFAMIGAIVSVVVAVRLPGDVLKIWIGVIVVAMGIAMIATRNSKPSFSWAKIIGLGTVASFNKGLSGGGYGPLVMGGQILSGIGVKNAVGITSLSESMVCLVGVILYFALKSNGTWALAPWLMAGAVLSVPFAAHTLKRIPERRAKLAVALVIVVLGALTLAKVLLGR